jgi:flagellar hook-length control protein FliK
MTAASVIATSNAAASVGDAGAVAPVSDAETASIFAGLIADGAPANTAEAPAADTAPAVASTKKGLLSSAAFLAIQQSGQTSGAAETTPADPVAASPVPVAEDMVADAAAGDADTSDKVKVEDAVATDQTVAQPPAPPVVPTPAPPTLVQAVVAAEVAVEATAPEGENLPAEAAPSDAETSAETPDAPVTASPVSTFEEAVANASATTSKTQASTNAASPTDAAPAAPTASTSVVASGAATNETAAPAATAPAAPAVTTAALPADTVPTPASPTTAGAAAPVQTAAQTPPPAVVPASLSQLSRATVETTVHLAAQITRRLDGRSTRFEMGLTPEGLGRVDVSLDIDSGGQLTARLAFDNPLAATELRGKADELRRELQDAGFTIAHDGLDFSEREPSSSNGGFDRQQGRAFASASRITADADLSQPAPAAWMSLALTPSGVDMKV